jgi:hypothetical protein
LTAAPRISFVLALIVQVLSSVIALKVPAMASAIAADLGVNPTLIGFYGPVYTAAIVSCLFLGRLPRWLSALRLSLSCIVVSGVPLKVLRALRPGLLAFTALVMRQVFRDMLLPAVESQHGR